MAESIFVVWMAVIGAICALAYAAFLTHQVSSADPGTERMKEVARAIREGAMAFIAREYKTLAVFVVIVAFIFAIINKGAVRLVAVSFMIGAFCSALAGYLGMRVATKANVRTANAARESLNKALGIAFRGGAVMGMSVVGLGVLGLGVVFLILIYCFGSHPDTLKDTVLPILVGFSFGASSIALFARVGGGIYTKAADVGADLVGKVEKNIPEDDPIL